MNRKQIRIEALLKMLPEYPSGISVGALHERIVADYGKVTRRTLERDLQGLSVDYPLVCSDDKPARWSWMGSKQSLHLNMDLSTALTLVLTDRYLGHLLPQRTRKAMELLTSRARLVMSRYAASNHATWPTRIHVSPLGIPVRTPKVADHVLEVVSECLLTQTRMVAVYQGRRDTEPRQRQVDPLGLVFRTGLIYLVCRLDNRGPVKQLALQRLVSATPLGEPVNAPVDFCLQDYVENQEAFNYPLGRHPMRLRALFDRCAADALEERRISEDQTLRHYDGERILLEATVLDSQALRLWLRSYGALVEVLEPEPLREDFKQIALAMFNYQGGDRIAAA